MEYELKLVDILGDIKAEGCQLDKGKILERMVTIKFLES